MSENPGIRTKEFEQELYTACSTIIDHEDAFIDLAFEMGPIEGLTPDEVKKYIRYIADRRLTQLELKPIYHTDQNPLPWLDAILNGVEHTNFFENRATEYSKAATRGTWEEAFE
jgi:ribonucleoside-diphosphate reductase beta chain